MIQTTCVMGKSSQTLWPQPTLIADPIGVWMSQLVGQSQTAKKTKKHWHSDSTVLCRGNHRSGHAGTYRLLKKWHSEQQAALVQSEPRNPFEWNMSRRLQFNSSHHKCEDDSAMTPAGDPTGCLVVQYILIPFSLIVLLMSSVYWVWMLQGFLVIAPLTGSIWPSFFHLPPSVTTVRGWSIDVGFHGSNCFIIVMRLVWEAWLSQSLDFAFVRPQNQFIDMERNAEPKETYFLALRHQSVKMWTSALHHTLRYCRHVYQRKKVTWSQSLSSNRFNGHATSAGFHSCHLSPLFQSSSVTDCDDIWQRRKIRNGNCTCPTPEVVLICIINPLTP